MEDIGLWCGCVFVCVQMHDARLSWYANEVDPIEGEISYEKFRIKSLKTKQNKK